MNCKQAKEVNIVNFLIKTGIEPTKQVGSNYWFNLRNEKTASLKVDNQQNVWFDYGAAKGGKLLELVMFYYNKNLKEALEIISNATPVFSDVATKSTSIHSETSIKVDNVIKLNNPVLIQYLHSRQIKTGYQDLIKEIHYTIENKQFYGLCWLNDNGGYEIRNKYFKGCIGSKNSTTINTTGSTTGTDLNLFEGMMDYLTALQIWKQQRNKTIVLNSLINLDKIEKIENYRTVNVFFDNDKAGKESLYTLQNKYNNIKDCSIYYTDYKDFNELIINKKP